MAGFGALAYDPATGLPIMPDALPDVGAPLIPSGPALSGTKLGNRLFGTGTEERFQTWPEKLVRSALTLPGDVASGEQALLSAGLRREDYTDAAPAARGTAEGIFGNTLFTPQPWQPNDPAYERAQDTAGLAGGGMIFGRLAPGVGEAVATAVATKPVAAPARPTVALLADSAVPGAPIAALEHIKTPEFKRWFGDSVAVDENGTPLVLYHGSNKGFSKFENRPSFRQDERGHKYETTPAAFFFTPEKDTARMFAKDRVLIDKNLRGESGGRAQTREFYLSTKNPLNFTIDDATHQALREEGRYFVRQHEPNPYAAEIIGDITGYDPPQTWREVQQALDDPKIVAALKAEGFDGAKLAEEGGAESWAVFDPHQIKSPKNKGTFDPKNPSVLREDAATGAPLAAAEDTVRADGPASVYHALIDLPASTSPAAPYYQAMLDRGER